MGAAPATRAFPVRMPPRAGTWDFLIRGGAGLRMASLEGGEAEAASVSLKTGICGAKLIGGLAALRAWEAGASARGRGSKPLSAFC